MESIDFDGLDAYLFFRSKTKVFVTPRNILGKEEIERLREYAKSFGKTELQKVFSNVTDDPRPYTVMVECNACKEEYIEHLSKSAAIEEIFPAKKMRGFSGNRWECDKCKKIRKKREKESQKEDLKRMEEQKEEFIKNYIHYYLTPGYRFKENVKLGEAYRQITRYRSDSEEIVNYIKSMRYQDFLDTPYWITVSQKVRRKAGYKCQLCSSKGQIHVHHRTYDIHGLEAYNLDDLIALCKDCHEKFHDIEK